MDIPSNVAASRLVAQQRAMEVVAVNIANANTPGFKAERVQFSDWLTRLHGTDAPRGDRTIAYTQDRATWREQRAGTLTHTGNPFDLGITSDGYFTVRTPQGPRLTRDGRFGLMPDGTVADSAGNAVLDSNGQPILLSSDRHADRHRRRRHRVQRERPARQDRRGAADRSDAARGRGRHAVQLRLADRRR